MKEYPVFIPFEQEHLAAIITVPDGVPRGLVLLVAGGGGAPRSHHHSMWTRAARGLATLGIASVRADWCGVGDSTGKAAFAFDDLPVREIVAIADFAHRATGVDRLGIAGNCYGARAALHAAEVLPACTSFVLMLLKPHARAGNRGAGILRAKRIAARIPVLSGLGRRVAHSFGGSRARALAHGLERLQLRADVLLMESNTWKRGRLPQQVERLKRRPRDHRLELRELPGGTKRAFHDLERQRVVVSSVVDWFDQTLQSSARGYDPDVSRAHVSDA